MPFLARERVRQESFSRRHWPDLEDDEVSVPSQRTRMCMLPRGHEAKAFFPPAAEEILAYCQKNRIPILAEARDLRSSLVGCLNVLFPLRENPALAFLALEPVLSGLTEVQRIEFDFSAANELGKAMWPASRGPRADAALWWLGASGQRCLTLICWKYTEASYGTCGGFRSRNNHHQRDCLEMDLRAPHPEGGCYLVQEISLGLPWDLLFEAGIRLDALQGVGGCPFRGPFYQIMRIFLLAAALLRTQKVDRVDVVFVGFRGNSLITHTPPHLAPLGSDIIGAWNRVVRGVPELRYVHAEKLIDGIRRDRTGTADHLLRYLEERYGF